MRTLVLWGRGFYAPFNLLVLEPGSILGNLYEFTKDVIATLVVCGAAVFVYYRAVRREQRMTLSGEGLLILGIISTMMIADMTYDGASLVLATKRGAFCEGVHPLGAPGQCASIATITLRLKEITDTLPPEFVEQETDPER